MIDGGIFLGRDATTNRGMDQDEILARLTRLGVTHALAVSFRAFHFDAAEGNRDTLEAARESGGRLVPLAAVSLAAFESMGLHRLWAESPNPVFNATVKGLGWTREGTKREAFLIEGRYIECWSILADQYLAARTTEPNA